MRDIAVLLATILLSGSVCAGDPAPEWVGKARSGASALGGDLKQALMSAMEQEGTVAAIDVCRLQAPAIAQSVSDPGMNVGRTALRVRNPGNVPDPWEKRTLADFQRRLAKGEDPAMIETFAVRSDGNRRYGHWMKAIPTQGLCIACHGTDIQPEVSEAIDAAYPQDEARGFAVGDLRGAFSVEVDLRSD